MSGTHTSGRAWILAIALISGACFCALVPWLRYGIPSGHDFEFHFNSWVEVLNHWRQGVIYPHWAAWAHYGYGEARFIFYPPASWTLGGSLSAALRWKLVPGAFVWLALTFSGVSMFAVAKQWLPPRSALFAAVAYALNPYHLIIVYWRSAFAELLAAAYLPLLLLCAVRLEERGQRMIAPMAVLLAAGWLTNVPSAVMMHYMLGVLVICIAISGRRWSVLAYAAIAVTCGAALAAAYLLPVWHQRTWVDLDQVLSPGVRPIENFLFAHTTDVDHNNFNFLISLLAVCEFAALAIALLLWRGKKLRTLWRAAVALGVFSAVIMLALTSPLWDHLPELRYVQFPWRWMLVLNLVLVVAVTAALQKWWTRSLVAALLLAPVLIGAQRIAPPWWDHTGDLWQIIDDQHNKIGNEGVDEYAPSGVDPYDVDQRAPLAKFEGAGAAKVTIERWDAEHRIVSANVTAAGVLVLRLFDYPSWQVKVDGNLEQSRSGSQGEIVVPLSSGSHRVEISFAEGWDRKVGAGISLTTLLVLGLWHKRQSRLSPLGPEVDS